MPRMIALCDILGFSDAVCNTPADVVVQNHMSRLSQILHHSLHQQEFPQGPPPVAELTNQPGSDLPGSQIRFSFTDFMTAQASHWNVVETAAWLLFETMIDQRIRMRVGISYGDVHIDAENHIYVGRAIVDAHRLERSQLCRGALTAEAAAHCQAPNSWTIPYDVPCATSMGTQQTRRLLAVDWTFAIHHFNGFHWSRSSPEPTQEDERTRPDIVLKWRNTRDFHRQVCRSCSQGA